MPGRKKFKIELEDAEGGKYNLSFEGNVTKEKVAKIVEFMDLINLEGEARPGVAEGEAMRAPASVGDRIWALVEHKFPFGSFTSSDIIELYEDTYNEPIKLSIISTYLSRYAERGRLARVRQGKEWVYRSTARQQSAPSRSAPTAQAFPSSALDQLR
jgi:hypothetical protein